MRGGGTSDNSNQNIEEEELIRDVPDCTQQHVALVIVQNASAYDVKRGLPRHDSERETEDAIQSKVTSSTSATVKSTIL